jgi:hypothetical protein
MQILYSHLHSIHIIQVTNPTVVSPLINRTRNIPEMRLSISFSPSSLLTVQVPHFAKNIKTGETQIVMATTLGPRLRELQVSAANSVVHWKNKQKPYTSQHPVAVPYINHDPLHTIH